MLTCLKGSCKDDCGELEPRVPSLWCSSVKTERELVKTRLRSCFSIETKNTDSQFLPLASATCLCVTIQFLWGQRCFKKAVSQCSTFTSCLQAGWVLHCLNGPVPCCHSLNHHTDPGWKKRQDKSYKK